MVLSGMVNKITWVLENGEHVVGIFLDFSKTFDTVNHDVLLWYKKKCLGVVHKLTYWVSDLFMFLCVYV